MKQKPEMLLWLSDSRGVYIPKAFADSFIDRSKHVSGVSDDEWAILEAGPDYETNELYWDVWSDVEQNAVVTDENGHKYRLWQDGDLWLVPEGMEWDDHMDCFDWPKEETGPEWEGEIADNH